MRSSTLSQTSASSLTLDESRAVSFNGSDKVRGLSQTELCEQIVAAQAQQMAAEGDDSGRDPNAIFTCRMNRFKLLRNIPMNARFVSLFFCDHTERGAEELVSEEMFDTVVDVVAQRPAIRWLSCQSLNFVNVSVDRVRKLLNVNANLFVEVATPMYQCKRFADDTINDIGKMSVDELRHVCFVCKGKLLEEDESVRKSLSPLQLSTMAEAWHTNRKVALSLTVDDGGWFELSEETREELLSRAFDLTMTVMMLKTFE